MVDVHANEHVGQDLPNESLVVDVGLSNVGDAKVVVHDNGNGGCDSSSDDEPLTKQALNAEFTIQIRKQNKAASGTLRPSKHGKNRK